MDLDRLACPEQPIELENRWERSRCSTSRTQTSHCSINGAQEADEASSLGRIYLWKSCPSIGNPWNVARQGLGVQGKLKKLDPWPQSMKQNRNEHRKIKQKPKMTVKDRLPGHTEAVRGGTENQSQMLPQQKPERNQDVSHALILVSLSFGSQIGTYQKPETWLTSRGPKHWKPVPSTDKCALGVLLSKHLDS